MIKIYFDEDNYLNVNHNDIKELVDYLDSAKEANKYAQVQSVYGHKLYVNPKNINYIVEEQ